MKLFLACAAVGTLAACAEPQPAPLGPPVTNNQAAPALDSAAIRGIIVGNTGSGPMSGSHVLYTIYVGADGNALIDLPTGVEHGAWRLTDDGQWCVRWQNYRAGQEYCQRVYQDGARYKFVNRDSEELMTFTPGKHIAG
jgi:hypothetical protein